MRLTRLLVGANAGFAAMFVYGLLVYPGWNWRAALLLAVLCCNVAVIEHLASERELHG